MKVYVLLAQYKWCSDVLRVFAEKPTSAQLKKMNFTPKEVTDLLEHAKTEVNSDDIIFELKSEVTYD